LFDEIHFESKEGARESHTEREEIKNNILVFMVTSLRGKSPKFSMAKGIGPVHIREVRRNEKRGRGVWAKRGKIQSLNC